MKHYSWDDLSSSDRRAVLRLARKGIRHPDPEVFRVAREWASDTLNWQGSILRILFFTVVGLLLGDAPEGLSLVDRRRARRILRATGTAEMGHRP